MNLNLAQAKAQAKNIGSRMPRKWHVRIYSNRQGDRVQLLRCEYREKVRDIEPKNIIFLDETGFLLGLMRHHARSEKGSRAYDLKPFYRGKKVTVIGAISIDKVLAVRGCLRSLIARILVARSPLTPLKKGGTGLLVPLFKRDLGGSSRA